MISYEYQIKSTSLMNADALRLPVRFAVANEVFSFQGADEKYVNQSDSDADSPVEERPDLSAAFNIKLRIGMSETCGHAPIPPIGETNYPLVN
jgi:hypothetical protein